MIHLIDFGASRNFPKPFVDEYVLMVKACGSKDREEVIRRSINMGFLTGKESKIMLDAHCEAAYTVGIPLGYRGKYDFKDYSKNLLTKRVTDLGQVMLKNRLTPPPEAYSLHRRLSGTFLSLMKLKAQVPCYDIFMEIYDTYDFGKVSDQEKQEYNTILEQQQEKQMQKEQKQQQSEQIDQQQKKQYA